MEGNYVLIEGFLHKQCKHACLLFGALWVKRFFVLYPGRLQYYRSEADRTQGLPQSREVEVDENVVAVSRKQSTMEVFLNATSMPMRLRASDPVQAGRWAAALMGRANTRTGASLRTASVTAETGRTRSNALGKRMWTSMGLMRPRQAQLLRRWRRAKSLPRSLRKRVRWWPGSGTRYCDCSSKRPRCWCRWLQWRNCG